ncbi:phage tail tube protein [Xanthobacter wiegelii]|uniref:phage tail tube protein n=1 Tax=Xanthobacter wiegelii TaxID=3119913 RepID=UPI00372C3CD6
MSDCCNQFGGEIYLTVDDTRYTPSEGDITLMPTRSEVEGLANQDGSAAYRVSPRLPRADISFRQSCGLNWDDEMLKCKVNATIVEKTNNRTHIFTGARFVGRPSINLSTGEVTGVSIEGGTYQYVAG